MLMKGALKERLSCHLAKHFILVPFLKTMHVRTEVNQTVLEYFLLIYTF